MKQAIRQKAKEKEKLKLQTHYLPGGHVHSDIVCCTDA